VVRKVGVKWRCITNHYSRDAHYLPIQPVALAEVKAHFPDEYTRYGVELGRAKVDEIEAQ
jgi:hypothetical protein